MLVIIFCLFKHQITVLLCVLYRWGLEKNAKNVSWLLWIEKENVTWVCFYVIHGKISNSLWKNSMIEIITNDFYYHTTEVFCIDVFVAIFN